RSGSRPSTRRNAAAICSYGTGPAWCCTLRNQVRAVAVSVPSMAATSASARLELRIAIVTSPRIGRGEMVLANQVRLDPGDDRPFPTVGGEPAGDLLGHEAALRGQPS